jgi:hypothetical protein
MTPFAAFGRRDGVIVPNSGGKWPDLNPAVYFIPDNGRFSVNMSFALPVWIKVHSLQTTKSASYNVGLAYKF